MASFKTAYLQREVELDVGVQATVQTDPWAGVTARKADPDATTVVMVGDLVSYTAASGTTPAFIKRVLSLASADYIVAQSDQTMEYGHVPVENRDYRYNPIVNGTQATVAANGPVKKVALFKIVNPDDVIINTANGETA